MKTQVTPVCSLCGQLIVREKAVVLHGSIAVWDSSMHENERSGILGSTDPRAEDQAFHNECLIAAIDKACGVTRPVMRGMPDDF